ncbi:MAG: TIM barrel protein [Abditibacteriaceae bacterium]
MSTIKPGLVSITFRQKTPQEIIRLCEETDLRGTEWGGDVHVPPGDLAVARQVRRWCEDACVQVVAYGSYYRTGHEEDAPFQRVLETALELGAPLIRVWAGKVDAQDADEKYFQNIVDESQRMGELAKEMNIKLAYEFHGKTLNNSAAASEVLFDAINHPAWQTLWQPLSIETIPQEESLMSVLPRLANLHVYHWGNFNNRLPLADGLAEWQKFFSIANDNIPRWALLEFIKDDDPANLRQDAAVLHQLLNAI